MTISSHRFCLASFLSFLLLTAVNSKAEIQIEAEVLSSDATSSTVSFTFTGDLSNLDPQVNLQAFLFLDFSDIHALENALPNTLNETVFVSNTVSTNTSGSINLVEVRNNEGYYFDRLSFVFDSALNSTTTFAANSTLVINLPTTAPITTADFNNTSVYWCFPAWGTNNGRGTLVGTANPVPETPTITITPNASGQLIIEFTGTLESSPDLATTFTPVTGATSPYTVPAGSPSTFFFRASTP